MSDQEAITTNDVEPLDVEDNRGEVDPITTNDVDPVPENQWGGAGADEPAHHAKAPTKKAH